MFVIQSSGESAFRVAISIEVNRSTGFLDVHNCSRYLLYTNGCSLSACTVKTFGLLQPYFDHLSCMPVVYVTRYKL